MTAAYDKHVLKEDVKALIDKKRSNINQFVESAALKIVNLITNNLYISVNTVNCGYSGSSGWTKGYDITIVFKLQGSDITIIINRKGYYELKFTKYTPSMLRYFQYLPGEEMILIDKIKEYFEKYQLKSATYVERLHNYAVFQNNKLMFTVFEELTNELQENSQVVGFKDQRFPIVKYIEVSFRNTFSQYKYAIAYKKKDNMILLCVETHKTFPNNPINLAAILLKLDSSNIKYIDELKNITLSSKNKLIDYLNQ